MSKSNVLRPHIVLAAGDMSGDLETPLSHISYMDNVCYHCNFDNTGDGVLNLQVSNDGVNWATVIPPAPNAAGFDLLTYGSPIVIDLNQTSAAYSRLIFTANGGSSGLLDVIISAKAV